MAPTNSTRSREDITQASSQLRQAMPLRTPHTGTFSQHPDRAEASLLDHLKALNIKNADTVTEVVSHAGGRPIDDRNYVIEGVIQLASQLSLASSSERAITNSFLTQLWDDLKYPPISYLGEDFIYRKAD